MVGNSGRGWEKSGALLSARRHLLALFLSFTNLTPDNTVDLTPVGSALPFDRDA